jgi:hypothetical protein
MRKPARIQLSEEHSEKARLLAEKLEQRGEIERYHTAYVPINRAIEWLIDQFLEDSVNQKAAR